MKKGNIAIFQIVILLGLLVLFLNAPVSIDRYYIGGALFLALFSIFLMTMARESIMLTRNPFTTTNFFLLALFITLFQVPIEFLLNNFDRFKFQQYFYDFSIVNRSIIFSSVCVTIFNLGQLFTGNTNKVTYNSKRVFKKVNGTPFFIITFALFCVHLFTVDFRYYMGGYSSFPLKGISLVVHGYLLRFIVISVFIVVWNLKQKKYSSGYNTKSKILFFFQKFPLYFSIMIGILLIITFFSGDRGVIIRVALLLSFSYLIISKTKINYFTFLILIVSAGFMFSISKLVGGYSGGGSYVNNFMDAQKRFAESDRSQSISPYTLELAGSIYSNNILFSLWESGKSLNGAGLIAGVLMAFPGGVTIFSAVTGLSGDSINSSHLSTMASEQDYGVGTSIVGDALVNLGFIGSLACFFLLGAVFRKADLNIYSDQPKFHWLLLGFIFIADVMILPRASMFNLIGTFIFDYSVIYIVTLLGKNRL